MAIKQRKQITGTTAQIKAFAGHEGVLAFDKEKKELHVLSGTAGTSTVLAKKSDIPAPQDISGKADKTYVDQQLATKEAKGTAYSKSESDGKYATKTDLNSKQPVGDYLTKANFVKSSEALGDVANVEIVKVPTADGKTVNVPTDIGVGTFAIPMTGFRGLPGGYEATVKQLTEVVRLQNNSPDYYVTNSSIALTDGAPDQVWTKVIKMATGDATINFTSNWKLAKGSESAVKHGSVVVVHWHHNSGVINVLVPQE